MHFQLCARRFRGTVGQGGRSGRVDGGCRCSRDESRRRGRSETTNAHIGEAAFDKQRRPTYHRQFIPRTRLDRRGSVNAVPVISKQPVDAPCTDPWPTSTLFPQGWYTRARTMATYSPIVRLFHCRPCSRLYITLSSKLPSQRRLPFHNTAIPSDDTSWFVLST